MHVCLCTMNRNRTVLYGLGKSKVKDTIPERWLSSVKLHGCLSVFRNAHYWSFVQDKHWNLMFNVVTLCLCMSTVRSSGMAIGCVCQSVCLSVCLPFHTYSVLKLGLPKMGLCWLNGCLFLFAVKFLFTEASSLQFVRITAYATVLSYNRTDC